MISIFNNKRIGSRIWCTVERGGISKKELVSWTHARIGELTTIIITNSDMTISKFSDWVVINVDV